MTLTPLDTAHAEMDRSDAARLRFYRAVAEAELILMIEAETSDSPTVFPTEDGPMVIAFDSEDRLADFAQGPAPYAAVPGRVVINMLAGQGVALGLNLGVAPSAFVMPPDAVDWLAATLADSPEQAEARVESLSRPAALAPELRTALTETLARSAGLATSAHLVAVRYGDGRDGHILALLGTRPADRAALAGALRDALIFSGVEDMALDIAFPEPDDPSIPALIGRGLRYDIPAPDPAPAAAQPPAAPGMDPKKPPKLR